MVSYLVMVKKTTILILVFLLVGLYFSGSVVCVDADTVQEQALIRDGFIIKAAEGKIEGPDSNGVCIFRFDADVNDNSRDSRAKITAGQRIRLLPSLMLQKMLDAVMIHNSRNCKLWAVVTEYGQENFIYPDNFLILEGDAKLSHQHPDGNEHSASETTTADKPVTLKPDIEEPPQLEMNINDANDTITIPPEIMAKIKGRKIIKPPGTRRKRQDFSKQPQKVSDSIDVILDSIITDEYKTVGYGKPGRTKKTARLKQDIVVVGRTGFIVKKSAGEFDIRDDMAGKCGLFVFDGLGRNMVLEKGAVFSLLPCSVLERAQLNQKVEPEQLRLEITGIVTEYQGRRYLLLQAVKRLYSYGNFEN